MKRYIMLIATGLMGITLLTACGSPSATISPTKSTNSSSIKETLVSKPTKNISQPDWVNSQLVYVIGWNQQVNPSVALYRSSDTGKTWTKVKTPLGSNIAQVHFQNQTSGFVYGVVNNLHQPYAKPMIFRTTDGGLSWEEGLLPESLVQAASQFGAYDVTFITSNGKFTWLFANWKDNQSQLFKIYHSQNNGFTWTDAGNYDTVGSLVSFHAPDDQTAYFVTFCADCGAGNSTGTNTLNITHNEGGTWSKIKLPFIVENQVQNLNFTDSLHATAIVKNVMTNKITRYRSVNGGHSWTKE